MYLFYGVLLFIIGLIIIIFSGNWMVKNAVKISSITGISQALIGATIVSLATTLPELSVTIFSSIGNLQNLAIGNAVGSVIFNLTFIVGIVLFFTRVKIHQSILGRNFYFMVFTVIFIFIFSLFGLINRVTGSVLIIIFLMYFVLNIIEANKNQPVHECIVKKFTNVDKKNLLYVIISFLVSSFFVAFGAKLLVENGELIAKTLNISDHIIGVTIIAIGTSLPEVVTAISSIRQKSSSIALGNTIGANVLSLTLLIGMSAIMEPSSLIFHSNITFVAIPIILLSCLVLYLPIKLKFCKYKLQGAVLLFLFLIYYLTVII